MAIDIQKFLYVTHFLHLQVTDYKQFIRLDL